MGSVLGVDPVVGSIPEPWAQKLSQRNTQSRYDGFPSSLGLSDVSGTCSDEKWVRPDMLSGDPGTSGPRGQDRRFLSEMTTWGKNRGSVCRGRGLEVTGGGAPVGPDHEALKATAR